MTFLCAHQASQKHNETIKSNIINKVCNKQTAFKTKNHNLGDKDNIGFRFADAAAMIITNESKTSNAGGADLTMSTLSICCPLKRLSTDSTSVIHCFYLTSSWRSDKIGKENLEENL